MTRWLLLVTCLVLGGCSTLDRSIEGTPDVEPFAAFDPYEQANRVSYTATDKVDRTLLLPVAQGYDKITPNWLQRGVLNIFINLRTIGSSVNGLLQGKPASAGTDFARLVINSSIGVFGFFDVASSWGLRYQEEDFGQTLAVWGLKRSRYLYVPLLGPTTLRDLPSNIVRSAMPRLILGSDFHWAISVVDIVSTRADLIPATKVRDASALDPYAFTRDAYYQRRRFLIFDGDPPVEDFFDEFEDELEE